MNDDLKKLIDDKAKDLNEQGNLDVYVSEIIGKLNSHIDNTATLRTSEIDTYLNHLIGFFTTTLEIPICPGLDILRARAYPSLHTEKKVEALSYIPHNKCDLNSMGRLNFKGESIYYGCIYFDSVAGGVNVAFSETRVKEGQTVNVLRSRSKSEVKVYFIGIYDYVLKKYKPTFLSEEAFDLFLEVYEYQRSQYSEAAFIAHLLCDAFFADVLKRRQHGNLYDITCRLSKLFLDTPSIDGIIYSSVQAEGNPVVALKTSSVDNKLDHISADVYKYAPIKPQ